MRFIIGDVCVFACSQVARLLNYQFSSLGHGGRAPSLRRGSSFSGSRDASSSGLPGGPLDAAAPGGGPVGAGGDAKLGVSFAGGGGPALRRVSSGARRLSGGLSQIRGSVTLTDLPPLEDVPEEGESRSPTRQVRCCFLLTTTSCCEYYDCKCIII